MNKVITNTKSTINIDKNLSTILSPTSGTSSVSIVQEQQVKTPKYKEFNFISREDTKYYKTKELKVEKITIKLR